MCFFVHCHYLCLAAAQAKLEQYIEMIGDESNLQAGKIVSTLSCVLSNLHTTTVCPLIPCYVALCHSLKADFNDIFPC